MTIAQSKLTAQGQISVPAGVRQKLGVGPGSVLDWEESDGNIIVRRATRFSSEDIHRKLFPDHAPAAKSLTQLKEGIRASIRKRHARG
jgi:AbrB family looped-hinge helix DNA binding protein